MMAKIKDSIKDIFSHAAACFSNSFTEDEITRISEIAAELRQIMSAAIEREELLGSQ